MRHVAPAPPALGARPDAAAGAGDHVGASDGGCAGADHRRQAGDSDAAQPEQDQRMLFRQFRLRLLAQPAPRIILPSAEQVPEAAGV